jgi:hypothetical protein
MDTLLSSVLASSRLFSDEPRIIIVATSVFIASIIYIFNPPITKTWENIYINILYNIL